MRSQPRHVFPSLLLLLRAPLLSRPADGAGRGSVEDVLGRILREGRRRSSPRGGTAPDGDGHSTSIVDPYDALGKSGYPVKPLDPQALEACHQRNAGLMGPGIMKWHNDWGDRLIGKCTEDPTCVSCLHKENVPMAERVRKTFHDPVKRDARRTKLQRMLGDPADPAPVVVFITSGGKFLKMLANWFCFAEHVKKFKGVRVRSLVYSTEEKVAGWAASTGVSYLSVTEYSIALQRRISMQFKWAMWPLLAELTDMGYPVLFSDTDAVWVRDPRPMLMHDPALRHLDFVTQLAPRWDAYGTANTGFMYFRPTLRTSIFLRTLVESIELAMYVGNQVWFNQVLRHHKFRSLLWRPLPQNLVVDFHTMASWKPESMVLHVVSNPKKKLGRLQDAGLWAHNESCPFFVPSDSAADGRKSRRAGGRRDASSAPPRRPHWAEAGSPHRSGGGRRHGRRPGDAAAVTQLGLEAAGK